MHQRASLNFLIWSAQINAEFDIFLSFVKAGVCFLFSGDGKIRCEQLHMITKWIGDFQATSRQDDEDVVFDVLCGDFNFDNCSPGASV